MFGNKPEVGPINALIDDLGTFNEALEALPSIDEIKDVLREIHELVRIQGEIAINNTKRKARLGKQTT